MKFRNDLKINDVLFMVLNYYLKYNLPQQGVEDLLRMLNVFSTKKALPESFSIFMRLFPSEYDFERVHFCSKCHYG